MTAVVVLNPSGGTLRGDEIITSDDYERFLPTAEELRTAMEWFAAAGFSVEAAGANSFTTTADRELFETVLGAGDRRFDTSPLPEPISSLVAAIEVPEPPDFGPGNP